ncbi:MAG: hypothetical protein WBA46_18580 [Thermomicrobiales bacterium]
MSATLNDLFGEVRRCGVTLVLDGDGVAAIKGQRLISSLVDQVREHKADLLDVLAYVDRLERGWTLCDVANDIRRDRLDGHWIALLHGYESLMDTSLADQEAKTA